LKIICGDGKEFNVHKAIVCPQSTYFRAACTLPMKVSYIATIVLRHKSEQNHYGTLPK